MPRGRIPADQANLEHPAEVEALEGLPQKLAAADASPDKWGTLPKEELERRAQDRPENLVETMFREVAPGTTFVDVTPGIPQQPRSNGALQDGVLPGVESVTFTTQGGTATLTRAPEQPHLPGLGPKPWQKVKWTMDAWETRRGAVIDKAAKTVDKAIFVRDEEVAEIDRVLEHLRRHEAMLMERGAWEAADAPGAPPWPTDPAEGASHVVVRDGWRYTWVYRDGDWAVAGTDPAPVWPAPR